MSTEPVDSATGTAEATAMGGETATDARISEPPSTLKEFFSYMGPAWVFTASQIGGGEALSVPVGGAYLGMNAIWLIPLITFTKIFGQYYLVRYGVMSGETFLDALYRQPKWLKWIFYYVFLGGLVYAIGLSGHLGETAGAAQTLVPVGSVGALNGTGFWMIATVLLGLGVVLLRSYGLIEKISTVLLWVFLIMIASVSLLTADQWAGGLASGLIPTVPGYVDGLGVGGLAFVATMFGWIGAGFGPTVSYVWFAKDKVMGMFEPKANGVEISKEDLTDEEIKRLKGWGDIVLWQNIVSSVILAVFSFFMWTAAAATLHGTEIVESGDLGGFEVIPQMATIFTSVYGEWSAGIFLLSVMAALFSTLIGPLYGMSRLWEDAFAVHGFFDKYDITRDTVFRSTVVLFAIIPLALNLVIEAPLFLFALSGIIFAPAVGLMYLAALYMSYTDIDQPGLAPLRPWAVALALFAAAALIGTAAYQIYPTILDLIG
ncbi:Nramp family divalent metal transporter [Haloplanus sp.]|uniref:Nramp family divalent metal transporter n=1 Tax=Haloplanus sp. TaxID=1961696 RepID=UPI0026085751|nr:Nramp family divalent metal transporter [Haloplanus sp.]